MKPISVVPAAARPAAPREASPARAAAETKLRAAADNLQSVFLAQLFQAMRASIPDNGIIERSSAEESFTQMLDERVAREAAVRMRGGVGEAMYQQLLRRLPPDAAPGE